MMTTICFFFTDVKVQCANVCISDDIQIPEINNVSNECRQFKNNINDQYHTSFNMLLSLYVRQQINLHLIRKCCFRNKYSLS